MRVARISSEILLTAVATLLAMVAPAAAQTSLPAPTSGAAATLSQAPQNPKFVEHFNAIRQGAAPALATPSGHPLGLIPEPLDLSHLITQTQHGLATSISISSSYDLRTLGKVTPVKDQGSCGDCWAFGTYGSMESILLPVETDDFSENNLKNLSGFDLSPCAGGNSYMSMAYLARWSGPVNESDDPYQDTDVNTSPAGLPVQKHVQSVIIIPARGSALNNSALKSALMTYGGVQVSMEWSDSAYDSATASYYYSTDNATDHSVTLVGWDDNYGATNFPTLPPGNGAFLIKNSWGTSWGLAGYFWVSYYDTSLAFANPSYASVDDEPTTNYARQYEYDPLGWVGSLGYNSSTPTTAWFANVFSAAATEQLQAVSFYAASNSSPYVVSIYTGVTGGPTNGILAATTSGTLTSAGYQTVALPSPVSLTNGMAFSVVVQLTTPGYDYPIPVEYQISGYSSAATASPGQSYFSADGTSWTDATLYISSANVCLKAFTTNSPVPTISSLSPNSAMAGAADFTLTVNGTNFVSGATVNWNGAALVTAFVNASQLTAAVPAGLIATMGTANVTVADPGGATSTGATFTVNRPPPTITSLSPSSATVGGAAFTLTINGTSFGSGAKVKWNGTAMATTYFSSTMLTAAVPGSLIATPGTASVTVTTVIGTSAGTTFTINPPPPTIASLSPSSATAGGASFTLTINGTNFVSGATVQWGTTALTTSFVSASQLTAAVPAGLIATAGTASVTVTTTAGTSGGATFTIKTPPSTITSLSPSSAKAGGAAFTLTVNGTNFVPGATVKWGTTALTTTFVSASQLTAAVPAGLIAAAGTASVTVTTTAGTSAGSTFTIIPPPPTITSLNPSSAAAGGAAFTLTINGTNFVAGAKAKWGATALTATFVSASQLTAAVPASLIAAVGTASVTVTTTGGTSAGATFTINSAPPVSITSLSPSSATAGGAAFTLTINGTNFVNGATVEWGSTALTTTFVSATKLTAAVPAGLITTAGTASVTVRTTGGTSAGVTFTINPRPTITSLSPSSATAGGAAFTLTVNGTGFLSGATVKWGAGALTTTFVSATKLTAAITAGSVSKVATVSVTVVNPGGGTSNAALFSVQ